MRPNATRTTGMRRHNVHGSRRYIELLAVVIGLGWRAAGGPFELITPRGSALAPPSGGSSDSVAPIISPDGRFVLFASLANNLVLNSNGSPIPLLFPPKLDVYLRDRSNQTTALVSVNLTGLAGGNDNSLPAGLSADGRYALFESSASDLIPGDTNNAADVFVRDLANGTTRLVSVNTNGGAGNGASRGSVITPDGRYVAFVSEASDVVPVDTNGIPGVFVRDLQSGATTLASVGATVSVGSSVASTSEFPDITPDGRYVAFYSTAANLVPGVTTTGAIYLRDRVDGTTAWASTDALTAVRTVSPSTTQVVCYGHVLSTNGQFVAYQASVFPLAGPVSAAVVLRYDRISGLTDVVSANAPAGCGAAEDVRSVDMTPDGRFIAFLGKTNSAVAVFVWDAHTGTATLASGDPSNNVPAGSLCDWPRLDPTGRFVLFTSSATNLIPNSLAGDQHVYLRDLQAAQTKLVDVDTNGFGPALSLASVPQMSTDARFVAFECPDASLVPKDGNRAYDLFVRDVLAGTNALISVRDGGLFTETPDGPSLLSVPGRDLPWRLAGARPVARLACVSWEELHGAVQEHGAGPRLADAYREHNDSGQPGIPQRPLGWSQPENLPSGGLLMKGVHTMNANHRMEVRDTADYKSALQGRGFTLIELLVVLAVLALGTLTLVPGFAHTQPSSRTAQCLSNKRLLQSACAMYTADFNDILVPNASVSAGGRLGWYNGTMGENWTTSNGNTNPLAYSTNCLAPCVGGQLKAYKCPGDTIPSDNGNRIRSISMNGQMGAIYGASGGGSNPGWRIYSRMSDLTTLRPAMAWIFADETMYSLNDGYLQMNLNAPDYPDVPAAYHGGINCLTFADGHGEPHRWKWLGPSGYSILNCPYAYGMVGTHWQSSPQDVDWLWLRERSAARQ
jgi:prepilin-type N-terminal cleavage/methylation domain-containing protein